MVSGLEFLRMVFQPSQSQLEGSTLPLFNTNNLEIRSVPADAGLTGLGPDVELQHPRPVRKVALQDALQRFEETAQFDSKSIAEIDSLVNEADPIIDPRHISIPHASTSVAEAHSILPLSRRVIQRPQKTNSQQCNYGAPALLGPIPYVGQSIWAPCPERQWPAKATPYVPSTSAKREDAVSAISASSNTRQKGASPPSASVPLQLASQGCPSNRVTLENTPRSSAMSTSPSSYSRNTMGSFERGVRMDDDSELEYISNFLDVSENEMDINAFERFAALVDEASDHSDDEYYTASVYSEYSENSIGVADRNEAPPRPPTILSISSYWASHSSTSARSSSYYSSSNSSSSWDSTPEDLPSSSSPPPHLHSLKRLSHTDVVFMDAVDRACQTFASVLR